MAFGDYFKNPFAKKEEEDKTWQTLKSEAEAYAKQIHGKTGKITQAEVAKLNAMETKYKAAKRAASNAGTSNESNTSTNLRPDHRTWAFAA